VKKIATAFFLILLNISIAESYIGSRDNRVEVDWNTAPYNQIVKIDDYCTGQFVSPTHILTAAHCINNGSSRPIIHKSDGSKTSSVTVLLGYKDKKTLDLANDYALLEIPEEYKSPVYFEVAPVSSLTFVSLAGFGQLRVLTDSELVIVRKKFARILRKKVKPTDIEKKFPELRTDERLLEKNELAHYAKLLEKALAKEDEDGPVIPAIFGDSDKLKVHNDCQLSTSIYKNVITSNCDAYKGNSGGAFFTGNVIHGVASVASTSMSAEDKKDVLDSPNTGQFYDKVQEIIKPSLRK